GPFECDPLRRLFHDGVRVADVQLQVGSAHRGAVADALDLERLREAAGDALDHVGDEAAGEPVEGTVLPALGRALDDELAVALLDDHSLRHHLRQLAERAVHHHAPRRDRHRHAGGQRDWTVSDSTHLSVLPDEANYFAADAELLRRAARDQAIRGGHDRRSHASEDAREAVLRRIDAPARLRDALDVGDDPLPLGPELELDHQGIERLALLDAVVLDVTLVAKQARDLSLHVRGRHLHGFVQRLVRVLDAGEHVCNWIGQHRPSLPARLGHARNDALMCELPQTDPAEAELAVDRARAPAAIAARVLPRLVLLRSRCLRDETFLRQLSSYASARNGRPSSRRSANASSSVSVDVVMVTSRPRTVSTSS